MAVLAKRILMIGAPGVGKGTYATRAAETLGMKHIAMGDILRREIDQKTDIGVRFKDFVTQGKLVPDELIQELTVRNVKPHLAGKFLLDGVPRTVAQAKMLNDFLKLDLAVNLTQPFEVIVEKVAKRRVCDNPNCGDTYNLANIDHPCGIKMSPLAPKKEGICDKCGSTISQRADDKEETVLKRLKTYEELTKPVLDFYAKQGIVVEFAVLGGVKQFFPKFMDLLKAYKPPK